MAQTIVPTPLRLTFVDETERTCPVARGHQTSLFDRLGDLGTGRLPTNASLDRQRYVILDTIGKGGMGAVYLAHDTQQARPVAIKEMSQARLKNAGQLQQARQRFQQEAAMLQALQHVNLPKVYGSFQENKRSYLVMEYVQGQSLFDILKQKNSAPLSVEDIISYGLQLCDVLIYLHSRLPPIIFRDLKPSNIMLRDDGRLFLIDFGIARFFSRERNHSDTEVFATPGYAPPEQYGGQTTPQSDIYSLGATLHHCLTGENPQSHTQTHLFHFTPANRLNPQVPHSLSELVQAMLSMQPQDRPTNIQVVRQQLQNLSSLHPNQIILGTHETVSPSDPTVNVNVATTTPPKPHALNRFSTLLTSLSSGAGIATIQQWLNTLKQNKGITIDQILGILWRQLVELSRNQHIWQRSFLISWLAICVLLLGGSIYLLRTVPDSTHLTGLVLIVSMLCLFGVTLSGKRLVDTRPRSLLILMAATWILAGLMLQAEPDMDVLIHSSLQSLTLSQIGALILIAGGLICLLRPAQRLVWLEPALLGLLALNCAFLQYGLGLEALQRAWPDLPVELANTLNVLLIAILMMLTLIALFRTPQPLQRGARISLIVVAASFTFLQYAFGFQEWQHILASDNWSPSMLQQLVILSFICTWAPPVCVLLALCLCQSWANRLALAVVAFVEAMMLSYQGQQISFVQFPGHTHLLATPLLSADTLAQLVGPVLVLVVCLTLFRLPHSRLFHALDHGVLLASALVCARMDDAFWQSQTAPLSPDMDQNALSQQFTILAGQLPAITIYLVLLGLPLTLLIIALCHLWRQSHPLAQIDPWLKRLHSTIIVLERMLTLALVSIAFILQGCTGALKPIITLITHGTFMSNALTLLDILVLLLICILVVVSVKIVFHLCSRSPLQLGKSERWALFLATISCLLLTIQQPNFLCLPLFTSDVQLTGNVLHWHPGLIHTLFFVSLLIPSLLAFFWTRRSFFTRYRELLRFSFLLTVICAMLQFIWSVFLPIGLIIFIISMLLLIQIEKVE